MIRPYLTFRKCVSCGYQKKRFSSTCSSGSTNNNSSSSPNPFGLAGAGILAGFVGSLVGLGGSLIALPIMTGPLGMTAHMASGTSMATVVATASGGAISYMSRDPNAWEKIRNTTWDNIPSSIGGVDVLTAVCLTMTSSITAVFGAKVSKKLSGRTLKIATSCFMLFSIPMILTRDWLKEQAGNKGKTPSQGSGSFVELAPRPLIIGAFSGFQAGLLGVGGGMIIVPSLCLFTDLPYQVALGTSLAAMLPAGIAGCVAHFKQGTFIPRAALPLAMGSMAGSYLGGKIGKNIDEGHLKIGFCTMMSIMGVKTLKIALNMAK